MSVSGNGTIGNLTVTGNLSVGNLFANNANYANYANISNTANSVAGANVTGAVAYATTANSVAGSNVSGAVNLATYATTANAVAGANVSGTVANATYATNSGLATYATTANSVAGANVSGTVANANYSAYAGNATIANSANSVAVANVSGIGNIATVNLDGNASNILYGNGIFSAAPSVSNVANANYANYAGNVVNAIQSNITAVGSLANLTVVGDITATSIVGPTGGGANIDIAPDGIGHVNLNADTVRVGDNNTDATIATRGTGNLLLKSHDGDANQSNINIVNGATGNIELNPKGIVVTTSNVQANYFIGNGASLTDITGANVTGYVANATHSNVADVANSVTAANVSGLGNIATINLDGNVSNALLGNGSWGPVEVQSTSISNGTSNINIPTANANILISTAGNANIIDIWAQGTLNLKPPAQGPLNSIRIDNYGRSGNVGAQRISSFRYRGNSSAPLSVEPGDYTMEFLTIGYNGSGIQTNSVAQIRAQVDSSYTANSANIPIGWQILVNDTAGNTNASKNHNFYSNGNVSFANSVSVNNDFTTSYGNITANSGVFNGNGSGLTNLTGANVTGTVANATYATTAGSASAIGNVANLNIVSSNTSLPTELFNTTGIVVGNTSNATLAANSMVVVTDYGNGQGDGNLALTKATAYVRARGTSASPTVVQNNDRINREVHYAYNGTANTIAVAITSNVSNINANADAVFSGGTFRVDTGNPLGDTGNANAQSAFNTFQVDQWGRTTITQGTAPTGVTNGIIALNIYGGSAGPNVASAPGIVFNRFRGNRDSNLSLQPNDQTGRIIFLAANGSGGIYNGKVAQITAYVDGSYVANTANVPQGMTMTVCDNTNSYTHNFYSNSAVTFAGNVNYNGNLNLTKFKETLYDMGSVSGSITPDLNNGSIQYMTLNGNITLDTVANSTVGSSFTLRLSQGGSGNYTLTANTNWKFASSFKTLSTTSGALDVISVFYDGSYYMATLTTGYA